MGLINDLKKLVFGATSVGKSAAEKVVETGKEKGAELLERSEATLQQAKEKTSEFLETTIDKAQDLGKNIAEKASTFVQHTVEKAEDLFEKTPEEKAAPAPPPPSTEVSAQAPVEDPAKPLDFSSIDHPDELELKPIEKSTVEKLGEKVIDTTLEAGKRVEKAAEDIGHKVLDAGEVAMEKFKETASQVGEKVLEKGSEFLVRAKEFGAHLLHKADEAAKKAQEEAAKEGPGAMDEIIQKAKEMGDKIEEKAQDTSRQFTDIMKDAQKSTLDKKDDFFEKAKRFADGDYSAMQSEAKITKDPNFQAPEKSGNTHGFEDTDGDGNDLIDDAVIDEKPE